MNTNENNNSFGFDIGGVSVETPATPQAPVAPTAPVTPVAQAPVTPPSNGGSQTVPVTAQTAQVPVQTPKPAEPVKPVVTNTPQAQAAPAQNTIATQTPNVIAPATQSEPKSVFEEVAKPEVEEVMPTAVVPPVIPNEKIEVNEEGILADPVDMNKPLPTSTSVVSGPVPDTIELDPVMSDAIVSSSQILSPDEIQDIKPMMNENTIIDTQKKTSNNTFFFIVLVVLVACVFYMNEIIAFFDTGITEIVEKSKEDKDNLVDGYILINENDNQIKIKDIRFYNFSKNSGTTVTLNYESSKNYSDIKSEEIYLELYNKEKEILYKEIFKPEKVEKDSVRTYKMILTSNVYADSHYALVKVYTKEEKAAKTTLVCSYEDEIYSYNNTYTFVNNTLNNYEVSKEQKIKQETEDAKLKAEFDGLGSYAFNQSFQDNKLYYNVDLNNLPKGYKPLYNSSLTKVVIKSKEELKKWNCK